MKQAQRIEANLTKYRKEELRERTRQVEQEGKERSKRARKKGEGVREKSSERDEVG